MTKVDVVVENWGGRASIVVARRRSVLEVSMSRKSEAVKDGVSRGREGFPSIPEMEDHRRFGFLEFLATRFSQYAASLWWNSHCSSSLICIVFVSREDVLGYLDRSIDDVQLHYEPDHDPSVDALPSGERSGLNSSPGNLLITRLRVVAKQADSAFVAERGLL